MPASKISRGPKRWWVGIFIAFCVSGMVWFASFYGPMEQSRKDHALLDAVERQDAAAVTHLLQSGANPNFRRDVYPPMAWWQRIQMTFGRKTFLIGKSPPPLLMLVEPRPGQFTHQENAQIARILLEHGADPNAISNAGYPVLCWAAACNYKEIVDLLLKHGANMNRQEGWGWTPLQTTALSANPTMIRYLLAKGADVHLANRNHDTAMSLAVHEQSFAAVQAVLSGYKPDDPARRQAIRDGLSEAHDIQANLSQLQNRAQIKQIIHLFQQELAHLPR